MTCRAASHYPFLDMLRLPFEETGPMYQERDDGQWVEFGDFDTPEQNATARERAQDTIKQIEKGE